MTLYYSLVGFSRALGRYTALLMTLQVFMLLVAEMALFGLLILPLPFNWRLKVRYQTSIITPALPAANPQTALYFHFRFVCSRRSKVPQADTNILEESPVIAKVQYGLKITFIFILILFLDSVCPPKHLYHKEKPSTSHHR